MKNKLGLFLFALAVSASYANAGDTACYDDCQLKYNDCMSRGYYTQAYCQGRMEHCYAACDGADGTPIP